MESVMYLLNCHRYFNIALAVFFPIGTLAGLLEWTEAITFTTNMIAIIALAKMLDLTTEQLSKKTGQTLGALINASFGNAVELVLLEFNQIIGIMALNKGLVVVVQSSLLGSILSNVLFVLGCCFYFGGLKNKSQKFSTGAANIKYWIY